MSRPVIAALLFSLFMLHGGAAMADRASDRSSDVESRNKSLVRDSFMAWKAGTGTPYDLLAEDATWIIVGHSLASKTYRGRESFLDQVIRPFNARMSEALRPTIRSLYADGNSVIVYFDAEAMGRDGQPYTDTYAWFLDMIDGKVVHASAFFDSVEFNNLWERVKP